MNLKDFIKESIVEISEAINEANEELASKGAIVNPARVHVNDSKESPIYGYALDPDENKSFRRPVHLLNFDIAVTASESEGKKGGTSIKVAGFGLGIDGKEETNNSINSRITFNLPVSLPTYNDKSS
ncbi:hypothetical protein AB4277_05055 [Vibrio splendidus]